MVPTWPPLNNGFEGYSLIIRVKHKSAFFSNFPENPDTVHGRTLIISFILDGLQTSPCIPGFWSNRPVIIDAEFLHGFGGLLAGNQTDKDANLLNTDFTHLLFNTKYFIRILKVERIDFVI